VREDSLAGVDTRGLVERVRNLPEGARRRRLQRRLVEVRDLLASPRCAETQADGVPCASAGTSCEECGKAKDLLLSIVREIEE
jgi:hypothetical protein